MVDFAANENHLKHKRMEKTAEESRNPHKKSQNYTKS